MSVISPIRSILFFVLIFSFRSYSQYLYNWSKSEGGNSTDQGAAICADMNGNVFTTGSFQSTNADFDPGPGTFTLPCMGNTDVFVSKFNSSGVFQWALAIGSNGDDNGTSITCDPNGNVIVTGFFSGTVDIDPGPAVNIFTSSGSYDIFTCKYNSAGNLVWAIQTGWFEIDKGRCITCDALGNIYEAGTFRNQVDFDPGPGTATLQNLNNSDDIFIRKLDPNGNLVYVKQLGGSANDVPIGMNLDRFGNMLTTGYFGNVADFDPGPGVSNLLAYSADDIFVSKLSNAGNFIWAKQMGGSWSENGTRICADSSANVFCTGVYTGPGDYDPGPGTFSLAPGGPGLGHYIVKLDASGNFIWAKSFYSQGGVGSWGLEIDPFQDIINCGLFFNVTDFDPGPGTYTLTSPGNGDIYMSKLDNNGNFLGVQKIQGNTVNTCWDMKYKSGYIYLTGFFNSVVDFDPGAGVSNLTASAMQDVYVAKFNNCLSPPVVPLSISGPSVACGNSVAVTFSVAPVYGALSYSWTMNGGIAGTSTTNILNTIVTGDGTVSIQALNACGISGIVSKQVKIDSLNFYFNTSGVCCSYSCNGSATVSVVSPSPSLILWQNGSTGSVVANLCAGVNSASVISAFGCTFTQNCFITSPSLITANLGSASSTICVGNCTVINANIMGGLGSYTYAWVPGNFTVNTISVCPPTNQTYTLQVNDACCSRTFTKTIVVDLCLGIQNINLSEDDLWISPNPASTYFKIHVSEKLLNSELKIYAIYGKEIQSVILKRRDEEINIGNLSSGIYILSINGVMSKMIKE